MFCIIISCFMSLHGNLFITYTLSTFLFSFTMYKKIQPIPNPNRTGWIFICSSYWKGAQLILSKQNTGNYCLAKYGSIGKCDGISIEIDGSVVGEAADGTVTGQVPSASGFDCKDCIIWNGSSVLCIVYNVDGSGKGTVSFQSHSKSRNCIYNNVTVKFLLVCGKYHLCAVAPAVPQPWDAEFPQIFIR